MKYLLIILNLKVQDILLYKNKINDFDSLKSYLRGTSDLGNARVKVDMLSSKFSYEKNS